MNVVCGIINSRGLASVHYHCYSHNSQFFPASYTPCQRQWEILRRKSQIATHGPAADLGPITERVDAKAAGLTDRQHGRKNLGLFRKLVMWGSHLHLHQLWAKYETICTYKPIICGQSESMSMGIHSLLKRSMGGGFSLLKDHPHDFVSNHFFGLSEAEFSCHLCLQDSN